MDKKLIPPILTLFPTLMKKIFHDYKPDEEWGDLNRSQLKVIHIIATQKNPCMTYICDHMNMEKGSMTSIIDQLIKWGLVQRKKDNRDRRKIILELTPKGKDLQTKEMALTADHFDKKLSVLSDADKKKFIRVIKDLRELVEKL